MRERLLEWLACPECRQGLELRAARRVGDRVETGDLVCAGCARSFPIRGFIPRFVSLDGYAGSFSFEWRRFGEVQRDDRRGDSRSERVLRWKTGWSPADLAGRCVLDAGVGAGRFAEVVSRWGAEVVGVDLSFSVETAEATLGERPNVHLVQADLLRPPFRAASFDAAYSIGVLPFTPDPARAFAELASLVRPGGELAVYVYARGLYHLFSDFWRRWTTRLPLRFLHALCWLAVPLGFVHRIPLAGRALRFLVPFSDSPDARERWLDTFDWYSPHFQWKQTWPEVHAWFLGAGYGEMKLFDDGADSSLTQICMRGRRVGLSAARIP